MKFQTVILMFLGVLVSGCSSNEPQTSVAQTPVAKVDDYVITVDDFQREVNYLRPVLHHVSSPLPVMIKTGILNDMINRELLLAEAEKLDIDKSKVFMNQVENFWRLSLIKALWDRKTNEIAASIRVTNNEVRLVYAQLRKDTPTIGSYASMAREIKDMIFRSKVQDGLEAWREGLRKKAVIVRYSKVLDTVSLADDGGGKV